MTVLHIDPTAEAQKRMAAVLILGHIAKCPNIHRRPDCFWMGVNSAKIQPDFLLLVDGFLRCKYCNATTQFSSTSLCDIATVADDATRDHLGCREKCGVVATLIKRVTDDGVNDMADGVNVGDKYRVFPLTTKEMEWGRTDLPGKFVKRESFYVDHSDTGWAGWMPTEMFRIEGN